MFVINANTRQSYLGGYAPTSGCYIPAIDGSSINLYFNFLGNHYEGNPSYFTLDNGFKYSMILQDAIYPNIYLCECTNKNGSDVLQLGACNWNGCHNLNFNALFLSPLKPGIIGKKICHNLYAIKSSYRCCCFEECGSVDLCVLHGDGTSTCIANLLNWDSPDTVAKCGWRVGSTGFNIATNAGSAWGLPTIIRTCGTQVQDGDLLYLNFKTCFYGEGGNMRTGIGFVNGPFYHTFSYRSCSCSSGDFGNNYLCVNSYHCTSCQEYRTFPIQISVD